MIPFRLQGSCPGICEPCSKHDYVSAGFSLPAASQNFLSEPPKPIDFPWQTIPRTDDCWDSFPASNSCHTGKYCEYHENTSNS